MEDPLLCSSMTPFSYDGCNDRLPTLEDMLAINLGTTGGLFDGDAVPDPDSVLSDELLAQFQPAVESSSVQARSSPFTGYAAASASLTAYAGRVVASQQQYNQSTIRTMADSISGGSSRSPGTGSLILTPASTLPDYNLSHSDSNFPEEEDTDDNLSPISDADYVHISQSHFLPQGHRTGLQTLHMSNNQHHVSSSQTSGASGDQRASRASSVAPSSVSFSSSHWGNVHVPSNAYPNNQRDLYGHFIVPTTYAPATNPYTSVEQPYSDAFSGFPSLGAPMLNSVLPFRAGHEEHFQAPSIYGASSSFTSAYHGDAMRAYGQDDAQMQQQYRHLQAFAQQPRSRGTPGVTLPPTLTIPSTDSLLVQPQSISSTAPPKSEPVRSTPSPMQYVPQAPQMSMTAIPSQQKQVYQQPAPHVTSLNPATLHDGTKYPPAMAMRQHQHSTGYPNRLLQAAKTRTPVLPSNASRTPAAEKKSRGGRQKGEKLGEKAKMKSSQMRKTVACWRCALQRDPCDDGMPCGRCTMRAQKGQQYYFDCDRSKLPDFVHDFLPISMTFMHQKQTIEDTVADQVLEWDRERPITVRLTSGYGPDLEWALHEFKPRSNDLLGQFQYLQDPTTQRQQRFLKYSPPFGLLKLDSSDGTHLEQYVDDCLSHQYLWDLGWTCYEEESQIDGDHFQARLLASMCDLFEKTEDIDLKEILREVLRMMVITYIMGHTLTIAEETLDDVLKAVKYSQQGQPRKFTSPRLANRQLKFFFAVHRHSIYQKILKWQQQTLHTSGKKEDTWLLSFCAMLGFAMVLEEVQRTILIQADAKAVKHEMSFDAANTEASNACERIDERFKLLCGLFQCKYRDKKWGEYGSFGPGTPRFSDPVAIEFLQELRSLTQSKAAHLHARQNVQFSMDNSCQYTSRLVARFLLPFLGLPSSSL